MSDSMMKRKDSRDLDLCYDYDSFVKVFDEKIKGWVILSGMFDKAIGARAADATTQGDMNTFQKFLVHTQDYFERNRHAAAGDFTVWQQLRLYAMTLETIAGLITESYINSMVAKLMPSIAPSGLIDQEKVIAEAKKMRDMSDYEYCNHILKESALLISDIQSDDAIDGYQADPRLEDFRLQIVAMGESIRQQGTNIGPEDRVRVDKVVGEAMGYTVNKLASSPVLSPIKNVVPPPRNPGKTGSDLN